MTAPSRLSRSAEPGGRQGARIASAAPEDRQARLRSLEALAFGGNSGADEIYNAGTALLQMGDWAQAASALRRAVRLQPGFAHGRLNLGIALHQIGRTAEAVVELQAAVVLAPDDANALGALATALEADGRLRAAIAPRLRLARLAPASPAALIGLGHVLERTGRYRAALAVLRRAAEFDPYDPRIHAALAVALYGLGRLAEARAAADRVLELRPGDAAARCTRAFARLRTGDLAAGWRDWEARLEVPEALGWTRALIAPRWRGETLPDATVLLVAEQGFGDTLQMARYAAEVRARVGKVVLWVPPPLVRLLSAGRPADETAPQSGPAPPHDAWAPMFSLPALFGPAAADAPAPAPYLRADPDLVQRWAQRLPQGRPRIGAVWRGSLRSRVNVGRSLPAAALRPLAEACGAPLISLQKELTAAERGLDHLLDLGEAFEAGDFADTAAIMQSLDLIVCCDTAAGHLAGALGRPVWVMLGANPDWRWLQNRGDTVWYPSMRLFRRGSGESWQAVLARMAAELGSDGFARTP
jgi:Flp pilus assembly protein TadD